jgi:hypothetical protein
MSDNEEEDPETGAGGEGNTPATDPGNTDTVGDDMPTTPHMGFTSDGGEFLSPSTLHNEDEDDEGNTGRARAPSERGSAGLGNSVSEQDLTERVQLTAEDIQAQEVLNAPIGASKLQDDVGGLVAASAQQRTTVPDVSLIPRQIATENKAEERHKTKCSAG